MIPPVADTVLALSVTADVGILTWAGYNIYNSIRSGSPIRTGVSAKFVAAASAVTLLAVAIGGEIERSSSALAYAQPVHQLEVDPSEIGPSIVEVVQDYHTADVASRT